MNETELFLTNSMKQMDVILNAMNKDQINESEPFNQERAMAEISEEKAHYEALAHVNDCKECSTKLKPCYTCGNLTVETGYISEDAKGGRVLVPIHGLCFEELLENQE